MGLASPSPQPAGERQCLSGVAGGLVDPPGREVGRPGAQKNERRPGVILAAAASQFMASLMFSTVG